jgi:hypothetical protein
VNSSVIHLTYCKNFCKCNSVSPSSTTKKLKLKCIINTLNLKKKEIGNFLSLQKNLNPGGSFWIRDFVNLSEFLRFNKDAK